MVPYMYIKTDNQFADVNFFFLEKFLRIIDNELSQKSREALDKGNI